MKAKRKYKHPLDLQMFSASIEVNGETIEIEDDHSDDELDIEIVDDEETEEVVDADQDEVEEVDDEVTETEEVKPKDKAEPNETGKAVIAERKKWQAKLEEAQRQASLTQKLMKMIGVDSIEALQSQLDAAEAAKIAKSRNITPEEARRELEDRREKEELQRKLRKLTYNDEARDLKKDPFFADLDTYREEFEEIAERTGQTLQEVYMAKRGRERMKEYEREVEERVKAKREAKGKTKVDTSSSGGETKAPKVDLPKDLMDAAKFGVQRGTFKDLNEAAAYYKKYSKKR